MKRMLYLVAYDIAHPKRLRLISSVIKDYASGGQKSSFECYLSDLEKKRLKQDVTALIDLEKDAFAIIRLVNREAVDVLGKAVKPTDQYYTYLG
jgi:CRISPR-associated protein Cas2